MATILGLVLLFGGMSLASNHQHVPFVMQFFWLVWPIGGILCAIVTLAMKAAANK